MLSTPSARSLQRLLYVARARYATQAWLSQTQTGRLFDAERVRQVLILLWKVGAACLRSFIYESIITSAILNFLLRGHIPSGQSARPRNRVRHIILTKTMAPP